MDKSSRYYFLAFAVLVTLLPCQAKTSTNLSTDQSALLFLKALVTSDPYQILARNWTNSSSVCNWIGVTCSSRHHRVTALNISNMGLSGAIPPQLENLALLVTLDLSNNSFSGFIPKSISNLTNLQFLDLDSNSLEGEIPQELGRLQNLQHLSMQINHLSGPLPSSIFNISSLQIMDFSSNHLSGGLPIDICANLPFLKRIYFYDSNLSGQIPSNLSKCSQLQVFSLSYNFFRGEIPTEIAKLENLQILHVGGNNLTGIIPVEIGNLHNLLSFGIERNQITGKVPTNIWNLTSLMVLFLFDNKLTGVVPREIGQLYQLEALRLDRNPFSGSIPPELFNISALVSVTLNGIGLSGTLPTNMCKHAALVQLQVNGNNLSGAIPDSISNCSNIIALGLAANKFTGFIPHSLGHLTFLQRLRLDGNNLMSESSSLSFITPLTNCTSLTVFSFSDNPIDGVLPSSIGSLSSSLQYFDASNCKIKGGIPVDIGNLTNLVTLLLENNELSGNIPRTFKNVHTLQGLGLGNNRLRGLIPEFLCNLHSLTYISLSRNQLSGSIPDCFRNASLLREVFLGSNILNSSIPSSLWHLTDLLKLDLSQNCLSGTLPQEMGNLVAAIYINLSMNQLSGSIPNTIGNLRNLVNLSLAHNRLEGPVPVSVGSMISLVTLDFSYNKLSGSIPKSMEKLQYLDYFNVSFNALSGEIPTGGPFKNFTMKSFKANEALCGISRFDVPLCRTASKHKSGRKKVQFALIILAGLVVLATVVSLVFIRLRYRRKAKKTSETDELVSEGPKRISYNEILHATEQFNDSNLLGNGSFGSVYKAIFRDGNTFAVKVFKLQSENAFKSFDVECEILRNIRHRNLTKVISSCSTEDFKALVLEYMPKGNLENWLYSHNCCLDIFQRLNIMIDVASALEYLHHGYSTPIVHCDIKPSNVLLDEEMIAHVSDFGISKLLGERESIVLTSTLATPCYIAPEYGSEGLVSTRCDVYSYGVMLMETFTKKRPSDDMFAGDLSLKRWVESFVPQSSHEVIDANLLMNLEEEEFDKTLQCVLSTLVLALKCTIESPRERINMKEALAELLKIKRRFSQRDHKHIVSGSRSLDKEVAYSKFTGSISKSENNFAKLKWRRRN